MTLYMIVPVFNRASKTREYLEKIYHQTFKDIEVIIVNDGSTDNTHEVLESYSKMMRVTELTTQNQWWGGSVNLGLKWLWDNRQLVEGDYVALANNDTTIPDDLVERMLQVANTHGPGFFHPRVSDQNKVPVSCGAKLLSWFPYLTKHPKFDDAASKEGGFYPVDFLTARFLLARHEVFKKIGLIPAGMPHYQGDYYLSYKARTLGMQNYIVKGVSLFVDNSDTGLKSDNLGSIKDLQKSFTSMRSSNNLNHRHAFVSAFIGNAIFAKMVYCSMVFNIWARYFVRKAIFLMK